MRKVDKNISFCKKKSAFIAAFSKNKHEKSSVFIFHVKITMLNISYGF